MRRFRSLRFAALFDSRHLSMDHRVKPGGDEGEGCPVVSMREKEFVTRGRRQ
jgi:hypothetical protein